MNIFAAIRSVLQRDRAEPWDPDTDEDVLYLRRQKALAEHETRRLREGAGLKGTGNIIEDHLTGHVGRYTRRSV